MTIVTREQWGARPPAKTPQPMTSFVDGWFIHWLGPAPSNKDEQTRLRGAQNFHMDQRGWSDIAYSYAIGQSGTVYEARGWGIAGGHTKGHNSTSMGIVFLIGEGETPTVAALRAADELMTSNSKYPPHRVRPHSAVRSTACPGPDLTRWAKNYETSEGTPGMYELPANREATIKEIQQVLRDAGYDLGPAGIDGDPGAPQPRSFTLSAVHDLKNDRNQALEELEDADRLFAKLKARIAELEARIAELEAQGPAIPPDILRKADSYETLSDILRDLVSE